MTTIKDFSCIGGLEKHIRVVKETVLFPLMYGEVYAKFNLRPPRGLLFYGPPGKVCYIIFCFLFYHVSRNLLNYSTLRHWKDTGS